MAMPSDEPITVLHVDDDEETQRRLSSHFADSCIQVESVDTGERARERFERDSFDCVLTEYDLPDQDAFTLLSALREVDAHIPLILFTASGSEAVASEAFSVGVSEYLRKATDDLAELTRAIEDSVAEYREHQKLAESEERYRTVVEGSHDGIYIYQGDGFVFVDDRVCEITGYDASELYEMEIWELIHPADRDRVRRIGEKRRREDEDAPSTYDSRIITKNDETRYLEFSVSTITYEGEWAALGSARDVTERRRREQELQAEQEFIQTILNTLDDVMFVCSLDGEILRWNNQLCELTGYTDEELAEMTVLDLLPDQHGRDAIETTQSVLSEGDTVVESEAVTKDGERIPFEFRGSELQNSNGDVIGIAGVARDIRQRREREVELARYQTIVEAVGDAVYTVDTDGNFTLVNEALSDISGYSETELIGEHVSKVMRDQDVETATQLIADLLKSDDRTNATFEMEAIKKDGEHVPCEDHIAILPGDDFQGTAGVVRDISDRKEREKQLERKNERLDQFAGVISHDLRNPLNVIQGRLSHARRTGDDEHFDSIERAVSRMERMIDDLLTLAREGETVGDVEPVAFDTALETAWQTVQTNEATLEVEGSNETILADPDRLASLLENLFRNAVEHGGDDVTVRAGTFDRDATEVETIGFYVADDGPGISEDDIDQIFEHGYSNNSSGTGLGLVIVDDIVDAHDWTLSVTESWERGARFQFEEVERFLS